MKNDVKILLVLTGHALEPVRQQYGDFDAHFSRATNVNYMVYSICDEWPKRPLPDPSDFDGVMFSGSAAMIDENKPWMHAAVDLIHKSLQKQIPLLGVCFGHQLLAKACGAKVGPNSIGRSNGTRLVSLDASDDPVFGQLPPSFFAQVSHRDVILEKTSDFRVIGTAEHDRHHVIKVGQNAWGVQFHPEWDIHISRAYIEARREILDRELGAGTAERLLSAMQRSPEASQILLRFVDVCKKNE